MKLPICSLIKLVVIALSVLSTSDCYKILGIFPGPIKSHFLVVRPLLKKLVIQGHHVTVVSHFPLDRRLPRYREVSLEGLLPVALEHFDLQKTYGNQRTGMYYNPIEITQWGLKTCQSIYSSERLMKLLENESFDLIIIEMFNSDCFLPINWKLKVPIIGITTSNILPWWYRRFGIPLNPSYVPSTFMDYPKRMNFYQRVENSVTTWIALLINRGTNDMNLKLAKKYVNDDITDISEYTNNVSLLLTNTHSSFTFAKPLPPNVIEVGGIHLEMTRPLSKNIEKFINESTHGVIYFSLGSMIKGHTFPEEKRQEFLKAFARLPQRVLWKWENETMPGKPDNIMIQKWMPQFDILSHPNVKAFISHAGLLGTTEAVHCGVPMLLMPQYGDQHTNARAVEANGGGIVLYLKDVTEEKVYESLKTLMSPEFTAKTKALSERFRDRPMSPMDTAIYWIEYVARHKGAPHLKTAAVDMPLYQYLLLDVIGFLALIFLAFSYIVYKIIRLIYRAIFSKNKVKKN